MPKSHPTQIKQTVSEILREFRLSRKDHAATFIKIARRFQKVGISPHAALKLAQETCPGSYADFVQRQNRGETLPVLFPREGYQKRLEAAVASGGRIN